MARPGAFATTASPWKQKNSSRSNLPNLPGAPNYAPAANSTGMRRRKPACTTTTTAIDSPTPARAGTHQLEIQMTSFEIALAALEKNSFDATSLEGIKTFARTHEQRPAA